MSGFNGFSNDTVTFLSDLKANNTKAWFDDNRSRYEAHYLEPAKDFVAAIGPGLQKLHAPLNAEPKVNGSIFRVNRDIRFSKDKTPYKPHIDLWFWEGQRKGALSGLFFRLAPESLILGAGSHGFQPDHLKAYRTAVADQKAKSLLRIESDLQSNGLELIGTHYKSLPRGFSADTADQERLLKFNRLHTHRETPHPANLGTPDFTDHCLAEFPFSGTLCEYN